MSFFARLAASASAAALLASPALAQQANTSTPVIQQVQLGDAFANMTVVSRDDARSATASSVAAGNSASGANLYGGMNASVQQTMNGGTFAWSTLIGDNTRTATAVTTSQANTIQAQTVDGDLDLLGAQTTGSRDINAGATVSVGNARTITAAASGAGNNAATSAVNGDLNTNLTQSANSSTWSVAGVTADSSRNTTAGASAAGNAFGSSSSTSTVDARYTQTSTGPQIFSQTSVDQGRARDVTAASTSAGNSASIANEWGYAQIRGRQSNASFVSADTKVDLGSWSGTAVSSAYGVGNATLATNVGSDLKVDVGQINTGGVTTSASFEGSGGGDAIVASTAIGNAFTGFVCSYCGDAAVSGTVNQSNSGNIASTGTIIVNSAGNLIGSASAIGNSASFITSRSD